jgi:hypothetical protein
VADLDFDIPEQVLVVAPGQKPVLYRRDQWAPPEGHAVMATVIHGVMALPIMPMLETRPEEERMTEYLMALVSASTFLHYDQLGNEERIKPAATKPLVMKLLCQHVDGIIDKVCDDMQINLGLSVETLRQLCLSAFDSAHSQACSDAECRHKMHDIIHKGDN